jgi:hypothetical protein
VPQAVEIDVSGQLGLVDLDDGNVVALGGTCHSFDNVMQVSRDFQCPPPAVGMYCIWGQIRLDLQNLGYPV